MKKTSIFIFCLLLGVVQGQTRYDYVFRVMVSSGQHLVYYNDDWLPLRTGMKLQLADQIRIGNKGFLGLAHMSGKTMEVRKAGIYQISKLTSLINTTASSPMEKYTSFLLNRMIETEGRTLTQPNHAVAAVDQSTGTSAIQLLLPEASTCQLVQNRSLVRWFGRPDVKDYLVKILNFSDVVLRKVSVSDTLYGLDLSQAAFKGQKAFRIVVQAKHNRLVNSEGYSLIRMSEKDYTAFKQESEALRADGDTSSLRQLVWARFYEEKQCYLNAIESYEKAIRQEPRVREYQQLYLEFLSRNRMLRKPVK
jgi:hypothetical protein